jgi:hypothetical protein
MYISSWNGFISLSYKFFLFQPNDFASGSILQELELEIKK